MKGDQLGIAFGVDAFHRTQAAALLRTQLTPVESGCCLGDFLNEDVSAASRESPVGEVVGCGSSSPLSTGGRLVRRRLLYKESRSFVDVSAGIDGASSDEGEISPQEDVCEELSLSEEDDSCPNMDEYEVLSCEDEVRPPQVG